MQEAPGLRPLQLLGPAQVKPFGHRQHRQRPGVGAALGRLAHQRLEGAGRLRQRWRCALRLRHAEFVEGALEIGVLVAGDHGRELGEADARAETVGGGDGHAKQSDETVDELIILREIAAHDIGRHGAGEDLADETVLDTGLPVLRARLPKFIAEAHRFLSAACPSSGGYLEPFADK